MDTAAQRERARRSLKLGRERPRIQRAVKTLLPLARGGI